MADKSTYMLICFCFIVLNMLIVRLYFVSDEFENFSGDSYPRTRLHGCSKFRKSNKIESADVSFIKLGEDLEPVWNEERDANYRALEKFSSRYLKSVKNPCWLEFVDKSADFGLFNLSTDFKSLANSSRQNKYMKSVNFLNLNSKPLRLRCLPYFMIIGQPKCGTTDLYFRITHHPQVVPSLVKGPHWWTRKCFGITSNKPVSFSSYIDLFSPAAGVIGSSIMDDHHEVQEQIVTGEASPSSLWDTSGIHSSRNNISDGKFRIFDDNVKDGVCPYVNTTSWMLCIPERIKAVMPNVRLIVILRNPAERLYSDYLFFDRYLNKSKGLFHQKVKEAILMFRACAESSSTEFCAYSEELRRQMEVRLHIGLYVVYLRNWMKVFKTNQFHVIRLEDYISRPKEELNQVFRFLQLNDLNVDEEEFIWSSSPLNRNPLVKKYGPMLSRTRHLLNEFYSPFNYQLSRLLKDSKFFWNKMTSLSRT